MKKLSLLAAGVLTLCLANGQLAHAANRSNGYIGVFDAGGNCCFPAPPGPPTTLKVTAVTKDSTGTGVTGAEFAIVVTHGASTDGYFISYTAPAGSTSLGSPLDTATPGDSLDPQGTNVVFGACQGGTPPMPGDHVDFGSITVFNTGGGVPCQFIVERKIPSGNPFFTCPLFTLCDAPNFTKVCMTQTQVELGGREPVAFRSFMNSPNCASAVCGFVAVAQQTWGGMKRLYR